MATSIFRLEEIRCDNTVDASGDFEAILVVRGHFSSLEKAVVAMKKNASETYFPEEIYAYLVKEIAIDVDLGNVDWLSVRSYDPSGNLLEKCLQDYNLVNDFHGRHKEDIHFKVGDVVEALCYERLIIGIIAALPPTPEDNFPVLDAMDDSYLILPISEDPDSHLHVPPTHVFKLQHAISEEDKAGLQEKLQVR